MIGFIIGLAAGLLQFLLLSRFSSYVTRSGSGASAALLGILQLLIPFAVLLGMAFIRRQELLLAGIGMTSALLISAVIRFAKNRAAGRRVD
ncbi:MAG: hypothetical protein ACOX7P_03745 [Oscillospiraceae bacterium]|jgi:hypothetical protein